VIEIDKHVADNYRALKEARGWTWEQLAQNIDSRDRNLAAWLRSQVEPARVRQRTRLNSEDA